jgi:hypothetical protein
VTSPISTSPADGQEVHGEASQRLVDYCARPACREEFRRQAGPGRRQAYCSEFCRRSAERELRQARKRLAHFEGVVEQLRVDVAAFGRSAAGEDRDGVADPIDEQRKAEDALTRVGGVLAFAGQSHDPLIKELRDLHDAVTALIRRPRP